MTPMDLARAASQRELTDDSANSAPKSSAGGGACEIARSRRSERALVRGADGRHAWIGHSPSSPRTQ